MTLQFILELESIACSSVELNAGILGNRKGLPVGREGMISDGVVEEVVDFWGGHSE
jgi:hypothetical protein